MGIRNCPPPARCATDAAPAQLEDPAPVLQAYGKRRILGCVYISITIALATLLLCVCTLALRYGHNVSQDLPAPGEHPPEPSKHALDVRLDPGVDISGLQCVAARLSPLGATVPYPHTQLLEESERKDPLQSGISTRSFLMREAMISHSSMVEPSRDSQPCRLVPATTERF